MLPVKTKCSCGSAAYLARTAGGFYYVQCAACRKRGDHQWSTMTVAIIDWEDLIKKAGSCNVQQPA